MTKKNITSRAIEQNGSIRITINKLVCEVLNIKPGDIISADIEKIEE